MTCKDCLHYEACRDVYDDLTDKNYNSVFDEEDYARIGCVNFTDRSEWVHLPCKVGDKVYICEARRVKEWVITFCGKNSSGEYKMIAVDDGFKNLLEFWDYDIGKTIFLTREEAEAVLKALRGEQE